MDFKFSKLESLISFKIKGKWNRMILRTWLIIHLKERLFKKEIIIIF